MRKELNKRASLAPPQDEDGAVNYASDEWVRYKNTIFSFWRVCDLPRCTRAKACKGEKPQQCWDLCWSAMPESHKEGIRAMIRARSGGASSADTIKAGDEAEAACLQRLAEDEAYERAAAAAVSTASLPLAPEQPALQPPMPSLRRL